MDTRETEIYHIIVTACVALLACLGLIVFAFVQLSKKIRRMHADKLVEEMKLLEAERGHIAAYLHDELGPGMAAVKSYLECLPDPGEVNRLFLLQAIQEIDLCIAVVRKETAQLMPVVLLEHGLVPAIDSFLANAATGVLQVAWRHHAVPAMNDDMALHVFRVIQEITYNTLKHAKANRLTILMLAYQDKLIIETEDDGIGFSNARSPNGMGLVILKRRIKLLGGSIHISSQLQKGTRILIKIPFHQNRKDVPLTHPDIAGR